MEKINFLKPTIYNIRKSIKGIDDSYNNFWDILAELLQNSVDAINKNQDKSGDINITIDCVNRNIIVEDTGVGIKKEKIAWLLSPFSSDKDTDINSIGEKGVGLKYVIFQTNSFKIITKTIDQEKAAEGIIQNAKKWKSSTDDIELEMTLDDTDYNIGKVGTKIIVEDIDNHSLFQLKFKNLEYLIRTKTAIGNVNALFDEKSNIKVNLIVTDNFGNKVAKQIDFKYWTPIENIKKYGKIDFMDFESWNKEADRSDAEKRNKLKGKIIYKKGEITHGQRNIKYWSCFVPSRNTWRETTINEKLWNEEDIDKIDLEQNEIATSYQAGIYTSVKGMPTGIIIENPVTGLAGYWYNIFIIFEDQFLKCDIGRKSINGNIKNIYKEKAKKIFNDYTRLCNKYLGGDPEVEISNPIWNREEIKGEIDKLPNLNSDITFFEKLPSEQEASVAGIFYELIGNGTIKEIRPIISGYRNKYDLYAYVKRHFVTIEFKSHLRNITRDFDDATKYSNEIDYIVCWDVNDDDIKALNNLSIKITDVEDTLALVREEGQLSIVTHKMIVSPTAKAIYIIDLKNVLKKSKEQSEI